MSPSLIKILGTAAMSLPLALGQLTLTVAPLPHVVMAALNAVAPAADGSLSACSVADARLAQCVRQVEGPFEELEQILPCACCSARRPFSTAYVACASYIATSLTHLSSDYTLFAGMYDICGSAPAGFCRASSTRLGFTAASDPPIVTSSPPLTRTSRPGPLHTACYSIGDAVLGCAEATPELLEAPLRSMAPCVCFSTGRGGSSTYVGGDIQSLARTCASWGRSALETDALILATPFTTLCQAHTSLHGTGIGPVPTATPSFGSNNNDEDDEDEGDRFTITYIATPTQQPSQETPAPASSASPTPDGAAHMRVNPGVIATAAVVFLALMQM